MTLAISSLFAAPPQAAPSAPAPAKFAPNAAADTDPATMPGGHKASALPQTTLDLGGFATAQRQGGDTEELSEEERRVLARLKRTDTAVRRHEQAHATVGGRFAGTPTFQFERGPNGRNFAVSGTTPIDVSTVPNDPAATIRKMEVVKRAAQAPADPSGQDRRVAAQAEAKRIEASAELSRERAEEAAVGREGRAEAAAEAAPKAADQARSELPRRAGQAGANGSPDAAGRDAGDAPAVAATTGVVAGITKSGAGLVAAPEGADIINILI